MVAACTAWADWKHRRATKTACDTPVGHPPPPRLYSDKSPLGEKGGVGALPVCVSAFIRCGREDRCLFPLSFGGLAQEYHVPPKIAPEERCTRFLNACRGCSRLPPGRPLALALPLPLARGRRSLKQLALNLGF